MNLKKILTLLSFIAILVSCNDNDYAEPQFSGIADIFVRCVKNGDEIHYAPVIYVYSNMDLLKINVSEPEATLPTYQTEKFFRGNSIRIMPESQDFSSDDLLNGVYEFEVISEERDTLILEDKLLDSRIDPIEITEFSYESNSHEFEINWEDIENSDVYIVKIMDEIDGNSLYISKQLYENNHDFNLYSRGWSDKIEKVAGTKYILGVFAYEFESEYATAGYDINSETVEYREIEW